MARWYQSDDGGKDVIYEAGYKAYLAGAHWLENPYVYQTRVWDEWHDGWLASRDKDGIADLVENLDYGHKAAKLHSIAAHLGIDNFELKGR